MSFFTNLAGTTKKILKIGKLNLSAENVNSTRTILFPDDNIDLNIPVGMSLGKSDLFGSISKFSVTTMTKTSFSFSAGSPSTVVTGAREMFFTNAFSTIGSTYNSLYIHELVFSVTTPFNGPNANIFSIGTISNPNSLIPNGEINLSTAGTIVHKLNIDINSTTKSNYALLRFFFPDNATQGSVFVYIKYQVNFNAPALSDF